MTKTTPCAVIIGATSGIGAATARVIASNKWSLVLCGRDTDLLESMAQDIRIRDEVDVQTRTFEATDIESHDELVSACVELSGESLDLVLLCQGAMAEQSEAEADFDLAKRMIDVNYVSVVSLCERFAPVLIDRGSGVIAVIGSVAGLRGRMSNYVYGSTKGAVGCYLSGLRNRLFSSGVHVLTILPGFVYTDMTRDVLKPNGRLVAKPEQIANDVWRAVRRKKNVLYTPWIWRYIMLIIRSIPEFMFKRMKL